MKELITDIDDVMKSISHLPKRYKCNGCRKQYVHLKNAWKHNQKKHEGKARFEPVGKFRWQE
ncbi:MAG: hypothetical protein MUP55_00670 [Candidatus Aenigmarchaeota archaeon]|nr:hypothetical protein [Candidatus Aenigmarchaeota archaeon]